MTDGFAGQSLTGERTLPHIWHENYWFRRHEAAYDHLVGLLPDEGLVVDAGCGEGYGSALLGGSGQRPVVAVDYDVTTLHHLGKTYREVQPVRANLVALPLQDRCAAAVVSLQVVEHIWEQTRYVGECGRLVRSDGLLALSTPNRLTFSPGLGRGEKPLNPFHINELDSAELVALLPSGFEDHTLQGLHHGPRIKEWESSHGSLVAAQLAEPYGLWPEPLAELVSALTAADFVFSPDRIDDSLDLLIVARRE